MTFEPFHHGREVKTPLDFVRFSPKSALQKVLHTQNRNEVTFEPVHRGRMATMPLDVVKFPQKSAL